MSTARPPHASPDDDVAGLGYEQARDELVTVVARLEAGAGTLEEALALWERGQALAARCQEWLDGARARLAGATPGAAAPGGTTAGDGDARTGPPPGAHDGTRNSGTQNEATT